MFPAVNFGSNRNDYYLDYSNELSKAKPHDCVPVDSNHPLYLLYTSGTTGTPKAVGKTKRHALYKAYSYNFNF